MSGNRYYDRGKRPKIPGRPPKPPSKKRRHLIRVWVSEEELDEIMRNAEGEPLSVFLREAGQKRERAGEVPRANREHWLRLSKLANNLNQAVRLAHTGRVPVYLEALLRQILQVLTVIQRELLGGPK
jgi:hypothetical protein